MNNLAETLHAQGDLAGARQLQERVLEERRGVLGEEHPETLTAMSNLAATLHDQGELTATRPPKPMHRPGPKIGRNEPCPCGSGKKYKKCHGANC